MNEVLRWLTASRGRELAAVATLFLLVACAATWPIVTAPGSLSVSDRANNDVFLNQYLIFWGAHAPLHEPGNLWHTNMFYPERFGFAYADMLLTDSLLLYPVIRAFYDPTLTYNILLWLAMVIGGTGMYSLARLLVGSRAAALVAGLVFVLNPTHFVRYRQPQFFNDGLLPWFLVAALVWLGSCGLWHRDRDADPGRPDELAGSARRSLALAAVAAFVFCLHAQTGSHNAVFGLLVGGAFVLWHAVPLVTARRALGGWPQGTRRFLLGAGVMAVIGVLVLAPLFYPYFVVGGYLESQRIGNEEAAARQLLGGSAGLHELFSNGTHFNRWLEATTGWPSRYLGDGDGPSADLHPGAVLQLLALLALVPAAGVRAGIVTRRLLAALLDLVLVLCAAAALAAWWWGWRRLGAGLPPVPTVWLWVLGAAAALAARTLWLPTEPHAAMAAVRALPQNRAIRFWLFVALVCFLAALGPQFGVYRLVHLIPGANLIRVPSRFMLPMVMALSVLSAWGVRRLLGEHPSGRRRVVLAAMLAFFVIESTYAPLPTAPEPYPPDPVAQWIGEQPGQFTVLELPIDTNPTAATRQMLQSIWHWQRLLIGYSGSVPPGYEERMERLAEGFEELAATTAVPDTGPSPLLDELRRLDVRYLVVLEDRVPARLIEALRRTSALTQAHRIERTSVWELR